MNFREYAISWNGFPILYAKGIGMTEGRAFLEAATLIRGEGSLFFILKSEDRTRGAALRDPQYRILDLLEGSLIPCNEKGLAFFEGG